MTSEVVDIKDAHLAALPSLDTFNLRNALTNDRLSLSV